MKPCLSGILFYMLMSGTAYGQRMQNTIPDVIFYNGKVITIDSESHVSEAFAVKDGHFFLIDRSQEHDSDFPK